MDGHETSGLRHRYSAASPSEPPPTSPSSAAAPAPEAEPLPDAPTGGGGGWDDQLVAARRALAARLGPEEDPDFVDAAEAARGANESGRGAEGEVGRDRRGSSASSEGDAEVREMLAAGRERPTVVEEAPLEEEEREAPGAFVPDYPAQDEDAAAAEAERPKPENDHMCRICFDGEDEELGRLFSPCQCRGTSRFVHVVCLDRWRTASAGATSFYKCDQCGYEYRLRRTKIAALAQNKFTLLFSTSILFMLLIYLAGFVANGLLYAVEKRTQSLTGSPFEDIFVSDYVIVGEGLREAADFFGKTVDKTGWKAVAAPSDDDDDLDAGESSWFRRLSSSGKSRKEKRKPPLVRRVLEHFIKGFSLVGIGAFFQTFLATALVGPFGLRHSLFRAVRPNRRNGDNETSFSQIVIVLFVLVGVVKAVQSTFKFVQWGTKKALTHVEGMVLDV